MRERRCVIAANNTIIPNHYNDSAACYLNTAVLGREMETKHREEILTQWHEMPDGLFNGLPEGIKEAFVEWKEQRKKFIDCGSDRDEIECDRFVEKLEGILRGVKGGDYERNRKRILGLAIFAELGQLYYNREIGKDFHIWIFRHMLGKRFNNRILTPIKSGGYMENIYESGKPGDVSAAIEDIHTVFTEARIVIQVIMTNLDGSILMEQVE
jgi:hypothetical protein